MYTNYLSLITSLPSSTYFSDYLSVQDSNFEKIDAFASTIAGSVSTLGSNVSTLLSAVASLGSDVIALSSAIANVNLNSALGISGSLTILSTAWIGSAYTVSLSNLGAYDAIFFKPYSVADKSILDAANPFVTISGSSISFNVQDTPSADVALGYYIDRGREVTQLATPSVTLSDDIVYWSEVSGATTYDVYSNGSLLTSGADNSVDLSTYLTEAGTYSITVVAKGVGYYDSDASTAVSYVITPPVTNSIYGVSGLYQSSPTLTRTDDAVGLSATVNSSTGLVSSDFDSVFPWNEATVETIGNNKFLHMPDMWFRIGVDANNNITDIAVSKVQGTTGNWYKVDSFYYGCYGGSVDANNKLCSVTGVARQHTNTRAEFRAYAAANGSGYHQLDLYHHTVMVFLWLIEWANKNSQSIMRGRDSSQGGTLAKPVNTGGTDSLTSPSGFNTSTKQMRYHYIEDFVGNFYELVEGSVGDGTAGSTQYVTADPSKFSDSTYGLNALSYNSPASGNGNCLAALGWDSNNPFLVLPKEVVNNSSYSKYFCDYGSTSNNVVLSVGTRWSSSEALHGVLYFGRGSASYATVDVSSRLLYKPAA